MGILSGNPQQEPMHDGEVFGVWNHLLMAKGCIPKYQMLINHTGDEDLKKFLRYMIENRIRPEVTELEEMLKKNGVSLPPSNPEKPEADLNSIPDGARMADSEIAYCVQHDIANAMKSCSAVISISIREDIPLFFSKHHSDLVTDGGKLLQIIKDKGWLIVPPLLKQ